MTRPAVHDFLPVAHLLFDKPEIHTSEMKQVEIGVYMEIPPFDPMETGAPALGPAMTEALVYRDDR